MKDKYLPIGTVVLLKNGKKKVMITGYLPITKGDNKKVFDYSACLFPEGFISVTKTAVFNHDQIEKIIQEGYSNEETTQFIEKLKEFVSKEGNNLVKSVPAEEPVASTPVAEPAPAAPEAPAPVEMPAPAEPQPVEMPAPAQPEINEPSQIEPEPAPAIPVGQHTETLEMPAAKVEQPQVEVPAPELEMPAPAAPEAPAPVEMPAPAEPQPVEMPAAKAEEPKEEATVEEPAPVAEEKPAEPAPVEETPAVPAAPSLADLLSGTPAPAPAEEPVAPAEEKPAAPAPEPVAEAPQLDPNSIKPFSE